MSVNPLANIFAGMNYATHRYDGFWTSVLGQGHGYDHGGWLKPGLTMAYNGTGRPERVLGPGEAGITNVYVTVEVPVGAADPRLGQHIANSLKAHIKRGGTLYPSGISPR